MELLDRNNPLAHQEYEAFVQTQASGSFLQSLRWPKVKTNWSWEALIRRDDDGHLTGAMLVLFRRVPLFGWSLAYAPRGPVCDLTDEAAVTALLQDAETLCRQRGVYLFRIDPMVTEDDDAFIRLMWGRGFSFTPGMKDFTTMQIRPNYMLDIAGKTEEEIFAGFHSKWRYNIRLAGRKGVTAEWYGEDAGAALDEFYELMKTTGLRDGFLIRPKEYFQRMLSALGEHARLYLCRYEGRAVSGAFTIQYAGKTCYLYGASDNRHRDVMPNHLMQWEMIRWAVESGGEIYDFQGIPGYTDETDPNFGIYRFKRGFGGRVVVFAGQFDLVLRPAAYRIVTFGEWAVRELKTLKRKIGGLLRGGGRAHATKSTSPAD